MPAVAPRLNRRSRFWVGTTDKSIEELVFCDSTLDWQKDDFELAIGSYVDDMSPELYDAISDGRPDFLRDHKRFGEDITLAVERLEEML